MRWLVLLASIFAALSSASLVHAQEGGRPAPPDAPGVVEPGVRDLPPSLRSWIGDMSPELRRSALERLREMPPQRRRAFLRRFDRMSEAQRQEFAAQLERRAAHRRGDLRGDLMRGDRKGVREHLKRMTPGERRRFRQQAERWRGMEPGARDVMRRRLHAFGRLSEAEQEALVARSFPDASPAERARKLEELRRAARAQLPRKPH